MQMKRICGHLLKMWNFKICFLTHEADHSDLNLVPQDWFDVCGDAQELLPHDAPEPLGEPVQLTHCVDANLFHDALTGCSATACLHFANGTPIDWCSKKQATVETATHRSELVAVSKS